MGETEQETRYCKEVGEWGHLPNEPCRFCRDVGGVFFSLDNGPHKNDPTTVRCTHCGKVWLADSTNA